jgi:hypothetical protein
VYASDTDEDETKVPVPVRLVDSVTEVAVNDRVFRRALKDLATVDTIKN